jgi:DNA uptake protein ComE-like DNA-binding protein
MRYREKGGKIRHIEQLMSIYGMDSAWVRQVADSINISRNKPVFNTGKPRRDSFPIQKKMEVRMVDLNTADSLTLLEIRGIGPYFANKILNYRRRLGGYLKKSQLLEIPRMSDSLYQTIEKNFYVDTSRIDRIDINTADFKTFIRHPYFTSDIIQKILKYRKQNGPFEKAEHISRIRHLKESEGQKILPYLSPQ